MKGLLLVTLLYMAGWTCAQRRVVCYYTNWSGYRSGIGKFEPSDIDPQLCTHVLYSFAVLDDSGRIKVFDPWVDLTEGGGKGGYSKVIALKNRNPKLKVLIAIGGWNERSERFSAMSRTAAGRKVFVDSVVAFIKTYGFDGLDLDWEFPSHRGGQPSDKQNFVLLIQDLQAEFGRQARIKRISKWELSAAVNPADGIGDVAYNRGEICRGLDFVNLMEYDMHGSWEKFTGLHAPLYKSAQDSASGLNIDYTVKRWINSGCDRSNLVVGIPTYGRSWTLAGSANGIGAPATHAGKGGAYSGLDGMLSYYEICGMLGSWVGHYVEDADTVYATGGNQWVSYDNEKSIHKKVMYIKDMNLGGAMIWALDFDDFDGISCGKGKYPLLSAINQALDNYQPQKQTTTTTKPSMPTKRRTTRKPNSRSTTTTTPTAGNPTGECKEFGVCPLSTQTHVYTDPCDPHKYIWCLADGRLFRMTCPGGLVIDVSVSRCVWPMNTQARDQYTVASSSLSQDQGVAMQLPPVSDSDNSDIEEASGKYGKNGRWRKSRRESRKRKGQRRSRM